MKIEIAANQTQWDQFLQDNSDYPFFAQSFEWGEILTREGKRVERLAVYDGDKLMGQAQIVWADLPLGLKYAFCPMGPVAVAGKELAVFKIIAENLKTQGSVFWRLEPETLPTDLCFKKTIDINPGTTTIINVAGGEDAWTARMKKNTRYSIRQALKNNLVVNSEKNLEIFWKLLNETVRRDGFKPHAKRHYEVILNSSAVYQLTAYHENIPVATAVFIIFGHTLTYLFAASDQVGRQLFAPYLLQLEALRLAETLSCKYYDMFGIAPPTNSVGQEYQYDPKHHYAKITLFKIGFGGEIISRLRTYDLVLNKTRYYFYQFIRAVRRWF